MANPVFDTIVAVNEGDRDVDTQIDVEYNDRLVYSANGEIWAGVWFTGLNGPQGWDNIDYSPKFPLPGTHPYSLLGRLDGRLFYIGRGFDRYYRGRNSRLFLRINDDSPGNGSGAVLLSRSGVSRVRRDGAGEHDVSCHKGDESRAGGRPAATILREVGSPVVARRPALPLRSTGPSLVGCGGSRFGPVRVYPPGRGRGLPKPRFLLGLEGLLTGRPEWHQDNASSFL